MGNTISLPEIEEAITKLSKEELNTFRNWFAEFDAQQWDKQFENDVMTGKLEALANKALEHLKSGNCTEI